MKGLFISNQRYGILSLVVDKMLETDVSSYLLFLFLFLFKYWATLYIMYPRAGNGELLQVPEFNQWYDAFKAMADFSLTGSKFTIKYEPEEQPCTKTPGATCGGAGLIGNKLSESQVTGIALFSWYYIWCSVMLAILLVRLLMAMMTNTFNTVRVLATRHWRLQFARCVLQMELIAGTRAGAEASSYHEVVTDIKVVDGVFQFKLFNDTATA